MLIQPIDWFLVVWFSLVAASTVYVAYDQFRHNPEPTVMKWAFILVTLYMGPVALLLYVMADKEPAPGEHEKFIQPLWKQGVGSTMHCVAGDATGIILAAAITALLGLPMWVDLIVEYLAGFAFGLFIFQTLFMKNMMGGTYIENVKRSFLPEFLSMNAMMSGMAPVMVFLMMGRDMRAMDPTELLFWGVMSLGVSIGFLVAYPVNVWLVSRNLKHGLMTERAGSRTNASRAGHTTHAKAAPTKAAASGHAQHQEHAPQGHAGMRGKTGAAGAGHPMGIPAATTAQLAAVTFVTILMLAAGMTIPALHLNMRVNAREVRDTIMPPGMMMTWDQPAAAMREMGAVLPRFVKFEAAADARGDRELVPTLVNGVKVFELDASAIRWNILPDVGVDAYAINGQVPGPRLHIGEGDHVRIKVTNHLPESTTLHWHGLILPNAMDGPADITQRPIPPGGSYVYEFTATQYGTYFYHSHDHPDRQQALGLYGAIIIDPKDPGAEVKADIDYVIQLQEWLKREGLTYPAMLMEGAMPNYFTINGKAYPATDTISMKVGQTIKLRFVGTNNNFIHPMHIHGGPFTVVARDGITLSPNARFEADTINVGPGQRYDVIWTARKPGKWLVHCHIPHHTSNNNVTQKGAGGLTMILDVS
jgi:FtsP/CotA-like multicopper oxidase with cupredoxin domain